MSITRSTLPDQVREDIIERILDGRIVLGERIALELLAEHLGISRTPLREALAKLENEGFVTLEPYRGYSITAPLNQEEIADLYRTLTVLEVPAAGWAALSHTEAEIHTMESTLLRMEQVENDSIDWKSFHLADIQFHQQIVGAAKNPYMVKAHDSLLGKMYISRILEKNKPRDVLYGNTEHRDILSKLIARDMEGVKRSMEEHLRNTLERVLLRIRSI